MRSGAVKRYYFLALLLFFLFFLFTWVVGHVDVQPIGPGESRVGLAAVNRFVQEHVPTDPMWDKITDLLALLSIATGLGFMLLALTQLFRRKSLWKVDFRLVLLAAHYVLMCAAYMFFEIVIVNYRPVLTEEGLEASYPSSHTMLVLCVMITAIMQFHWYLKEHRILLIPADLVSILLILQAPVGRILAGMHWFTDVLGGCLLSAALCMLYYAVLHHFDECHGHEKGFG